MSALAERAEREHAKRSLTGFSKYIMHDYLQNWHHRLICKALDMQRDGVQGFENLMILMGPRRGKTMHVLELDVPYSFGLDPGLKVIYGTRAMPLARKGSRKVRGTLNSDRFQSIFNARLGEAKSVDQWDVTSQAALDGLAPDPQGAFLGVSVGKGFQGFGASKIILDDYFSGRAEAESQKARDTLWSWWNDDLMSRAEYPCTKTLMCTPWHMDDVAGRLLRTEPGEWRVIRLPERITEQHPAAGPYDPRELGEFLWPGFYGLKQLKKGIDVDYEELVRRAERDFTTRRRRDSYGHDAMFQCYPRGRDGTLLGEDDVLVYNSDPRAMLPTFDALMISIDCNFKNAANTDRVSILVAGRRGPNIYVVNEMVLRCSFPQLVRLVVDLKRNYPPAGILIETKANGQALIETLRENVPDVLEFEPGNTSKTARAQVAANRAKAMNLFVPDVRWCATIGDWTDEVVHYGERRFDDRMDSLSQLCIHWQDTRDTKKGIATLLDIWDRMRL